MIDRHFPLHQTKIVSLLNTLEGLHLIEFPD